MAGVPGVVETRRAARPQAGEEGPPGGVVAARARGWGRPGLNRRPTDYERALGHFAEELHGA